MKTAFTLILLLITNVFIGHGQEANSQRTSSINEGNVQGTYTQKIIVGGGSTSNKGTPKEKMINACFVKDFNHQKTSDRFGMLSDRSEIYPGNALTGKNFINGNYAEVGKDMNPIKLYMTGIIFDNDNDQVASILDPSPSSIQTAISRMIRKPKVGTNQANFLYESSEIVSSSDINFNLNIHTDMFLGADISNKLSVMNSKKSTRILVTFVQKYFTISSELPNNKGKIFKDGSLPDDDMCYIRSVTYGRKGMLIISINNTTKSIKDSLDAHKSGIASLGNQIDINSNFFKSDLFKKAEIAGYFYGGSAKDVGEVVYENDPVKTVERFFELMKKGVEFSVNNFGKPIEYEVAHLKTRQTISMEYKINQKMTICESGDKFLKITLKSMKAEQMKDGKYDREGELYGLVSVHMSNGEFPLYYPLNNVFQGKEKSVERIDVFDSGATAGSSSNYRYIYPCSGGKSPFNASAKDNWLFAYRSGNYAIKIKEGETKQINKSVAYLITKDDMLNKVTFFADLNEFDSDDENEWLDAGFEEKIEKTLQTLMQGRSRVIQTQRIFKDGCSVLLTYEMELLDKI